MLSTETKGETKTNNGLAGTYLSVIIPAFNEEKNIGENVDQVVKHLSSHLDPEKPYEIIVVNDGSSDKTHEIIEQLQSEKPYIVALHHERNRGRGAALRTGFLAAKGHYIITLEADLSYSPEYILKLLHPLETNETDLVLASAYHEEGSVINVPFSREIVSRLGNRMLSVSLGGELSTVTCMVRGYRREVLESLELFSDDKDIHLEIIQKAKMLGFRIMEIPAELRWKSKDRDKLRKTPSGSFRKMVSRHLFYNFVFRPSMLLWLPTILLGLIFFTVSITIINGYLLILAKQPHPLRLLSYYYALGEHINWAKPSYFVWSISLIFLFQFLSLVFIAKQNNHYYRELFTFLSRLKAKKGDDN